MLNRDFHALIIAILNRNRDREKIHLLLIYLFATIICVMTLFVERGKHNHCCKAIIMSSSFQILSSLCFGYFYLFWVRSNFSGSVSKFRNLELEIVEKLDLSRIIQGDCNVKVYPHIELWLTIVLPIIATIVIDIFIFRFYFSRERQRNMDLVK